MPRLKSTAARGYGGEHAKLRKRITELVESGGAVCWRCGQLIVPRKIRRKDGRLVSNWHLGHDDNDRTVYRGPEHERCNIGAVSRNKARRNRRRPRVPGGFFGPLSS